jgi:precorrin-2 dehydrogenase/sirohydrochlorin ferrochelatase
MTALYGSKRGRMAFPVTLLIAGKSCVVVGGDGEAQARAEALLAAGAVVTVIARAPHDRLRRLAQAEQLRLLERDLQPSDVEDAFLVFNTVRDAPAAAAELLRLAQARRFLLSSLDQPEFSTFTMPAIVSRGRLRVAISTGGVSPALARRLRQDMERLFDDEFEAFLEWLGGRRREIQDAEPDPKRRAERLRAGLAGFRLSGKIDYPTDWRGRRPARNVGR